jgi:hypothetical protein
MYLSYRRTSLSLARSGMVGERKKGEEPLRVFKVFHRSSTINKYK